jgi:hypothetical protein
MTLEAGQINSILRRKQNAEDRIINDEEKASQSEDLIERKEKIMPKVLEQYEIYENVKSIIDKAQELLREYGSSSKIPAEELDFEKSGFDDARLLAFCEVEENKKNRTLH